MSLIEGSKPIEGYERFEEMADIRNEKNAEMRNEKHKEARREYREAANQIDFTI
jgi:hypothetical protein